MGGAAVIRWHQSPHPALQCLPACCAHRAVQLLRRAGGIRPIQVKLCIAMLGWQLLPQRWPQLRRPAGRVKIGWVAPVANHQKVAALRKGQARSLRLRRLGCRPRCSSHRVCARCPARGRRHGCCYGGWGVGRGRRKEGRQGQLVSRHAVPAGQHLQLSGGAHECEVRPAGSRGAPVCAQGRQGEAVPLPGRPTPNSPHPTPHQWMAASSRRQSASAASGRAASTASSVAPASAARWRTPRRAWKSCMSSTRMAAGASSRTRKEKASCRGGGGVAEVQSDKC